MDSSYNNSFGSFYTEGGQGMQQSPVISGGDVLLSSEKKKKPFLKILFVFLGLAIIVAIVLIVVLVSTRKNEGVSDSIQKYANYIINGDENNSDIGDGYSKIRQYYYLKLLYDENKEEWDNFYNKTIGLLDGIKESQNQDMVAWINPSAELLKTFNAYRSFGDSIVETFINKCASQGDQSLLKYIETQTSMLSNMENDYSVMYRKKVEELGDVVIDYIGKFRSFNCLSQNYETLKTCELDESQQGILDSYADKIVYVENEVNNIIVASEKQLAKMAFEMLEYNNERVGNVEN